MKIKILYSEREHLCLFSFLLGGVHLCVVSIWINLLMPKGSGAFLTHSQDVLPGSNAMQINVFSVEINKKS